MFILKSQNLQIYSYFNFFFSRDKPTGCEHCPRRFVSEKHLKDHTIKFHYNHVACPYCFRAFACNDTENFRKHMFRHEHVLQLTQPHECIQCGYSTLSITCIR